MRLRGAWDGGQDGGAATYVHVEQAALVDGAQAVLREVDLESLLVCGAMQHWPAITNAPYHWPMRCGNQRSRLTCEAARSSSAATYTSLFFAEFFFLFVPPGGALVQIMNAIVELKKVLFLRMKNFIAGP